MASAEILVVEDDGPTRDLLRISLELEGYSVALACNGIEGLQRLREDPPALVLLDIMMPAMDGAELLGQIRNDPSLARLPVIVLSAFGRAGAVAAELAQEYVPKPFDLDVLVAAIARHCSPSRAAAPT